MMSQVTFPNLWSRLILGRAFQRQFIVAERSPRVERFLGWLERRLRIDHSRIPLSKPIFIIGLPRTGSTLLQNLLCLHQDVGYITNTMNQFPECFCAAERLRAWLRLDVRGERFLKDSVEIDAGSPNEGFGFWGTWLEMDPADLAFRPLRLAALPPDRLEAISVTLRKVLWCMPGKSRLLFKNPAILPYLDVLAEMFPDARFIYLVRDPRECANSLVKLCLANRAQLAKIDGAGVPRPPNSARKAFDAGTFVPFPRLPRLAKLVEKHGATDIRTTARLWNDAVDFVDSRRHSIAHLLEVRYEDLVSAPERTLQQILDFCELPPYGRENALIQQHLTQVGVIRHKNNYGNFDVVERICADGMRRYGYSARAPADAGPGALATVGDSATQVAPQADAAARMA